MRRPITALLAAALLAVTAGDAPAAVCQTQPGQGAIDQYCEIIPSGAGDRPIRPGGGGPAVDSRTHQQLRDAGADGAIVEALAATSPAPRRPASRDGATDGGAEGARPGNGSTGSAGGLGAGTGKIGRASCRERV